MSEWNREAARETLQESVETIRVAVKLARESVNSMESVDFSEIHGFVDELRTGIEELQEQGLIGGSRREGKITRSQANAIITVCNRLIGLLDVRAVIRMSLDLTTQADRFIGMMEKVTLRYGEEDRLKQEDITELLTTEQNFQVLQWIKENRELEGMLDG